jgi:hypothetical protein
MNRERPSAAQLAYLARQDAWRSGSRGQVVRNPYAGPRRMVEHKLEIHEEGSRVLQLPLYVLSLNKNGSWEYQPEGGADSIKKQRKMLWDCCMTQLRGLHIYVAAISFERLSPSKGLDKHDNLRSAFKFVCDALCAWIVEGPNVRNPRVLRKIGTYDDLVLGTWSIPCEYSQRRHESHGIRVGLKLGPSRAPTPKP